MQWTEETKQAYLRTHNRKITVIRGLPGAGKSTYARNKWPDALLLEGDQYYTWPDNTYLFGENKMWSNEYVTMMVNKAAELGVPHIVVTCTSPDLRTAAQIFSIAKQYRYDTDLIWLECSDGDAATYGELTSHNVPEEVIKSMQDKWITVERARKLYPASRFPDEQIIRRFFDKKSTFKIGCSYRKTSHYPQWFKEKLKHGDMVR